MMTIEEMSDELERAKASKEKEKSWAIRFLALFTAVAREKKRLETTIKDEQKPYKDAMELAVEDEKADLITVAAIDGEMRELIKERYSGTDTVGDPSTGELVFTRPWGYDEPADIKKVDPRYTKLVLDTDRIKADIKDGVRKIKGLNIREGRVLQIRPSKAGAAE